MRPTAFILSMGDGNTWEIGPCEEVDDGVIAWAHEFCSIMGPGHEEKAPARRLFLGRVCRGEGPDEDLRKRFSPPLPEYMPEEGLKITGIAGLLFFSHPAVRDIFCGLYPVEGEGRFEQMRRVLMPLFAGAVAAGGLPIHGALVERRGAGVLLLGRSGAGKTTCCQRLPPGWTVLGDDLALAVPHVEDGFRAHPLPTWSAVKSGQLQWPCRAHFATPLRALFLLEQSERDELLPIRRAQAAVMISHAASQVLASHGSRAHGMTNSLHKDVLETALRLAGTIPVFRLRISLTGRFWERIDDVLGGPIIAHESRVPSSIRKVKVS